MSGALNANVFKVAPAKADAASSMPAIGLVYEDILNGGEGQAVSFGKAGGLNTASYAVGDTVYVSPTTAGGLTNIKPSGVDEFIQNVGIVSFVNAITGVIKVTGVGRANDVPNKVDAVIVSVKEDLRSLDGKMITLLPVLLKPDGGLTQITALLEQVQASVDTSQT